MKYVALIFLAACGSSQGCPDPKNPPSYATDIAPLIERSCTGCHSESVRGANRNSAPRGVDYDTPEQVAQEATQIIKRLDSGGVNQMPPASATQPKFSPAEVTLFRQWNACGANP